MGGIVGNFRVDNNVLPFSVFEKSENSETVLDTILHNQIIKKFGPGCQNTKSAKKPTIP